MGQSNYQRVIVKLSGEALSGPEKFGIHQATIDGFAGAAYWDRRVVSP